VGDCTRSQHCLFQVGIMVVLCPGDGDFMGPEASTRDFACVPCGINFDCDSFTHHSNRS
jgi:hypothetical protein